MRCFALLRSMANFYRHFGTSPSPLQGSRPIFKNSWPLKMGPIICPETSVKNKHYPLRNSPEERSSHLLHGGSFKPRKSRRVFMLAKNTSVRIYIFFQCHHMSSQTSWSLPPSPRLWLKCNQLLRLGRPVGAVTLSRWEWWWNERWIWGARGDLKPNFY